MLEVVVVVLEVEVVEAVLEVIVIVVGGSPQDSFNETNTVSSARV